MKNIRSLFKHWKRQNKKFFKFGQLREETLDSAIESFVHYLELHNVKQSDVTLYVSYLEKGENYIYYMWPICLGFILDNILAAFDISKEAHFWLGIGMAALAILQIPITLFVRKEVLYLTKIDNNFLRICLNNYLDLHKLSDKFNKLETIRGNLNILVPPQSEYVYDDLMHNSKYYWKAHSIYIVDGVQPFNYVFYTNKTYSSDSDILSAFYHQCFSQVGKQWKNIGNTKITICEIKTVNFLEYE